MLPRALASLLCLLGAVALGLGVASATVWRADDTLVATVRATTLVATEPGVLDLAADEVTVRAEAQGDVVIALGRTADVEAWIGTDPHTWVTGLVDRRTLSTHAVAAVAPSASATAEPAATPDPAATPAPEAAAAADDDATVAVADPTGSDLWVAEATGGGEAELEWSRQDGRWSVLVAAVGPDAGPVTLELTWPQVVTTPWLVPGAVLGGLLLLAGLVWWVVLLWGTRWLGPVGALSRTWSAHLLALLRHEEHAEDDRRPSTHTVPVVERARHATGEVERARSTTSATDGLDVPDGADVPDGSARGRTGVNEPSLSTPAAGAAGTPGPVPDDGAPLTRRQLRERAAAAEAARPQAQTSAVDPTEEQPPRGPGVAAVPTTRAVPTVAAPTPSASSTRRRIARGPSWLPGRRHPADVAVAPAPTPEPVPELPAPAAPSTVPSASADAWRRAWGIPSTPDHGGSTDASEGEDR